MHTNDHRIYEVDILYTERSYVSVAQDESIPITRQKEPRTLFIVFPEDQPSHVNGGQEPHAMLKSYVLSHWSTWGPCEVVSVRERKIDGCVTIAKYT